jgi:hypothetical protein
MQSRRLKSALLAGGLSTLAAAIAATVPAPTPVSAAENPLQVAQAMHNPCGPGSPCAPAKGPAKVMGGPCGPASNGQGMSSPCAPASAKRAAGPCGPAASPCAPTSNKGKMPAAPCGPSNPCAPSKS